VTAPDAAPRTLHLESKYVPSRNVTLVGTGGQTVEAGGPGSGGNAAGT
jgi:hypothetical protein